jgi:hypothetical protein
MTCGRIDDPIIREKFFEVVKRALGERADAEYCIYERDIRGYIVPRVNPQIEKAYACGAYAALHRSYKLLVVPGAVIAYNVDLSGELCRVLRDYDAVLRYITRRPHYTVCIYDKPVGIDRALICAC